MEEREKKKASFIIPTLNEQSSIRKTIRAGFNCDSIDEVVVVDGKSEDKTYQIAENEGARVVTQPNGGKGEAIRIGLSIAENPISILMDADILNIKPEMKNFNFPLILLKLFYTDLSTTASHNL